VLARSFATAAPSGSKPSVFDRLRNIDLKETWGHTKVFFKKGWAGTKQLYYNTKKANVLRTKLKQGLPITRREHRFIQTNRGDLWRAGPFLLCWKIPLLGKLVTLYAVFKAPWILPSTFEFLKPEVSFRKKLEDLKLYRRVIASRLPQEHKLNDRAFTESVHYPLSADDIALLVDTWRADLDLSKLSNNQLAALLNALDTNGWGLSFMLRKRVLRAVDAIRLDDALIEKEGVDTLTEDELEEACRERGLVVDEDLTVEDLRAQLSEWLRLDRARPDAVLPLLIYLHAYRHSKAFKPRMILAPKGYVIKGQLTQQPAVASDPSAVTTA
jgi:LETM1 and EF-hand domain-containing protein 1